MTRPDPAILAAVRRENLPKLLAIADAVRTVLDREASRTHKPDGRKAA